MAKDLTVSRIDRQNILNNDLAVQEIQENRESKESCGKIKYTSPEKMLLHF